MINSRVFGLLLIGMVSASFSASQATAACVDSAPVGDGWGWDGRASCRITESTDSCIDIAPFNDGWGWNGLTSCVISSSDTRPDSLCIDTLPEGDGWGWDGSSSCQITTPDTPTASTCKDTGTVGDGWGWDGSQSCKLGAEQFVRTIMPVGDSITHGAKGMKSYRYHLLPMLEQEGCTHTMVGSQLQNEVPTGFTSPHESYSTMKADHFLTGYSTWSGNNMGIRSAMTQFVPDVVFLHIGSNDVYFHESTESTAAEIYQVIQTIKAVNPDTTVLVSNIIPWFGSSDANRSIVEDSEVLGDAISELVESFNSDSVIFVDVYTGYTRDMMISDLVHPNVMGEQHIASAFLNAYTSAGLCR